MSPRFPAGDGGREHDRARRLAAARMDEALAAEDAAWLEGHLDVCPACAAVAAEHDLGRELLRAARAELPAPPRDLWARTASAIEAEAAGRQRRGRPAWARWVVPLAPVAAVAAVAVAVGTSMLGQAPAAIPTAGPAATPIVVAAADVQLVRRVADGLFELSVGTIREVCPVGADACGGSTTVDRQQVVRISAASIDDVLISPTKSSVIILDRAAAAGGVYVVQVGPVVTPSPAPTATPAPRPTDTPPPTPAATPTEGPPSSTPVEPTASPSDTVEPTEPPATEPPGPTPTPIAPATEPPATPSPSPSVEVTPRPDGALEIASNVVIVGSIAAYSSDGLAFAFTARPADGSAGPDVYVWRVGDAKAIPVTTDHASLFADWLGDRLLISRGSEDGIPSSVVLDSATGEEFPVNPGGAPVFRPTVGPDGTTAVWWDGTVAPSADGFSWEPGNGRLVLGTLVIGAEATGSGTDDESPSPDATGSPDASDASPEPTASEEPTASPKPTASEEPTGSEGPTASEETTATPDVDVPSASPDLPEPQLVADGPIHDWQVRWDETGAAFALWVADEAEVAVGRLSLYAIDPETRLADTDNPILDDAPAIEGISLEAGRLAWAAPDAEGRLAVEVLAWSGDSVGQVTISSEDGISVVR